MKIHYCDYDRTRFHITAIAREKAISAKQIRRLIDGCNDGAKRNKNKETSLQDDTTIDSDTLIQFRGCNRWRRTGEIRTKFFRDFFPPIKPTYARFLIIQEWNSLSKSVVKNRIKRVINGSRRSRDKKTEPEAQELEPSVLKIPSGRPFIFRRGQKCHLSYVTSRRDKRPFIAAKLDIGCLKKCV